MLLVSDAWMYVVLIAVLYILNLYIYEGWNINSGNYLFTTDTK